MFRETEGTTGWIKFIEQVWSLLKNPNTLLFVLIELTTWST